MSDLRVNTISASDGTSPVALTKQEATKFWVTYDAVNGQTKGSLNQSSLIDETTGRYHSTFINAFGSATDRCATVNAYNSTDNSSFQIGKTRGGIIGNIGTSTDGTFRTPIPSEIQYTVNYGATASSNGNVVNFLAVYVMAIGDLA
jgi:hypothetical protein